MGYLTVDGQMDKGDIEAMQGEERRQRQSTMTHQSERILSVDYASVSAAMA